MKRIILLSVSILVCLSACGRAASLESGDMDSAGGITSGSAVAVSSRRAETVSLERETFTGKDLESELQFPAKEQIAVISREKSMWYWKVGEEEEEEDAPYFAVTDFDMDGYLEILVMENPQGKTELYEVDKQGTGLAKCEISEEIFHWHMDNPLCAYKAEESGQWYLGRKPSDSVGTVIKYYIQYCTDNQDADLEMLSYTWEEFTLYEALDIREWEEKLTAKEKKQLHAIADTMDLFGGWGDSMIGYMAEYAVCDLDQDGSMDLLMRISMGSGIVREYYIGYAVDEEGIRMIMDGEGTRSVYSKPAAEEDEERQQENSRDISRMFLHTAAGMEDGISCYQDKDSGEIRYVFEAVEETWEGETDLSGAKQYQMVWNNPDLLIRPVREDELESCRKGKASLHWVERCAAACPDYQYENALASYLGWELRWTAVGDSRKPVSR